MIQQFAHARIGADDVWNLVGEIDVNKNDSYDQKPHTPYTTHPTITFNDGTQEEQIISREPFKAIPEEAEMKVVLGLVFLVGLFFPNCIIAQLGDVKDGGEQADLLIMAGDGQVKG